MKVTTTERVGRAMIHVALSGYSKRVLEHVAINTAAAPGAARRSTAP